MVAALSAGVGQDPLPTVGAVPEARATTSAVPAPAQRPTPGPDTRSVPAPSTAPPTPVPSPAVDVTPSVVPPPQRLRVAALGVTARVVAVSLTADGAMELPDDVTEVGWFSPGPVPGQSGSAVLAGHVDSREQGRGVLFDLPDLVPGDTVEVDAADGDTTTWRVVGRTAYAKDTLPIAELFRRDGPPRLVLITCGGDFDPATGHYDDNVVVVAEPA